MTKDTFSKYQSQVLENLKTLKYNLDKCEQLGMEDLNETIYNELSDLIDLAKTATNINDLEETVFQGKMVETKIDMWYTKEGITNLELTWPEI